MSVYGTGSGWSNSRCLNGNFPVLNRNVLVSAWSYLPAGLTTQTGMAICSFETDGLTTHYRGLAASIGGAKPTYYCSDATGYTSIHANTTVAEQWSHIAGYDPISTDRHVWLNDVVASITGGAASNPNTPVASRIGCRQDGGIAQTYYHAEISAWDVSTLSFTEVDNLVNRLYTLVNTNEIPNPRVINEDVAQPWTGKLLRYWPLTSISDTADALASGDDFTVVGGVVTAAHPTVQTYSATSLYPDTEALYYGATLLANKTNIEFLVTAGHTGLNGEILSAGTNATTDASGLLQLPSAITGTAADPVTVHLYWEEGTNPVVDRSLVVKTTLVAV